MQCRKKLEKTAKTLVISLCFEIYSSCMVFRFFFLALLSLRLEALMAAVPGPIKEAHVIILHRPISLHHCLLSRKPGVNLINESLPGADLPH